MITLTLGNSMFLMRLIVHLSNDQKIPLSEMYPWENLHVDIHSIR